MKDYPLIDYTEKYNSIMVFDKNRDIFVHRWYPFVEGYSKEFIEEIIQELPSPQKMCYGTFLWEWYDPCRITES